MGTTLARKSYGALCRPVPMLLLSSLVTWFLIAPYTHGAVGAKAHSAQPQIICSSNCTPVASFPGNLVQSISIIQPNGGRVDWSPSGSNLIAFERLDTTGEYNVYTMTPDGTIASNVTNGNPGITQENNGNPAWYPGGKYIVFQSEAPTHYGGPGQPYTQPGSGTYNNLWLTTPTGSQFWQLTDIPIKQTLTDGLPSVGSYNAHFSHSGAKLAWAELYARGGPFGQWRLKIADFVDDAQGPHLANITILLQRHRSIGNYVVPMAFSPDDSKLLIAGNLDGQPPYGMDLYMLDLTSGQLTNLTSSPSVWEEDSCWSPSGSHIVYLSNIGSTLDFNNYNWQQQNMFTDYWIMNADGSNKQRLTFFNDPSSPEYIGQGARLIAGDCSFSPDGSALVGKYTIYSGRGAATTTQEKIMLIQFSNPL